MRQPFFGETHIHTRLSLDAIASAGSTIDGNRRILGPEDAYRFARGEDVAIPRSDGSSETIRIDRPLDFAAVTDHSEFLGVEGVCNDSGSFGYGTSVCKGVRDPATASGPLSGVAGAFGRFVLSIGFQPFTYNDICGPDGADCIRFATDAWSRTIAAAEAAYDRTQECSFTSFIAYEWTLTPGGANLHRNVIFRNEVVPRLPISVYEAPTPPLLWKALREQCLDSGTACDALAIPHNPNLSGGHMFADELSHPLTARFTPPDPIDAQYAVARSSMEPLVEIYQEKGESECHPVFDSDEECSFEKGAPATFLGPLPQAPPASSFVRDGLGLGLVHREALGVNPFAFGFVAATDAHDGRAGGAVLDEVTAAGRSRPGTGHTGGVTGVWAEENTRDAIFRAMRRRETFATSGPRITPRFFGGWDLGTDLCDDPSGVAHAYAQGVPMGADLPPASGADAPVFFVAAESDFDAPVRGTVPLEAVQIVKVWLEDHQYRTRVYDVAGARSQDSLVDLATCESTAPADAPTSLCATWTDPDFDPLQHALYYARVLEVPTCRWSTLVCARGGYDCGNPTTDLDRACCRPQMGIDRTACEAPGLDCLRPETIPPGAKECCEHFVEPVTRQRAWTSPIWYVAPEA